MITAKQIKELRDKTGAPLMKIKKALAESKGNVEKAIETLRKQGAEILAKRADKQAKEGYIGSYIHSNGKVAAFVQLLTETDFVAKNEEFRQLANDIAMHVVAMSPRYLKIEDVSAEDLAKEKKLYEEQAKEGGKPANVVEKIVEGKLEKFKEEMCLLTQPFVRDDKMTINDLINEKVSKMREKIEIGKFVRFEI